MGQANVISLPVRLEMETCITCGIAFAVPSDWRVHIKRSHEWFYCPNGHQQHYSSESDMEKARRLAREAEESRDWYRRRLDSEQNHSRALRGHLTRQKTRAAAGACPCCKRTFKQLARHMKAKHPDYAGGTPK